MRLRKKLFAAALVLSFSVTLVSALVLLAPEASAQAKSGYQITTSLPGTSIKAGDFAKDITIAGYVAEIYRGALVLVGVIALAAMVYWGVRYAASGGNASKTSDAKDGITQALLGLVLLLSAYILLRLINHALVDLSETDKRLNIGAVPKAIPDEVLKVYNGGEVPAF